MTVQKIVGDLFRKFVHDFLEFALYQNMGGSYGGTPIAGWFIKENPKQTWMIIGCTPISGNLHINIWWFPKNLATPNNSKHWCFPIDHEQF